MQQIPECLAEAKAINRSLSALGDVVSALTSGAQHVPYRNHALTQLMSDSLGGTLGTPPDDKISLVTALSAIFVQQRWRHVDFHFDPTGYHFSFETM